MKRFWVVLALASGTSVGCGGGGGGGDTSGSSTIIPVVSAPATPSGLQAISRGSSRIDLTWQDLSSDEDGFEVDRSVDGATFVTLARTGANTTSHTDSGLPAVSRFYYRVRAFRSSDLSSYSLVTSAITGSRLWSQVSGSAPAARYLMSTGVYDPLGKRMIIFGGTWTFNDVWAFDLSLKTWAQLHPGGDNVLFPSRRHGHTTIYDVSGNRLIVFGGLDHATSSNLNDVWGFSLYSNTWTQLDPGGAGTSAPPPVRFSSAIHDPIGQRMLVFGGYATGATSGLASDVWAFSLSSNTWTKLSAGGCPARRSHTAVYDAAQNRMVVFGGLVSTGDTNDVWGFSLSANQWVLLAPPDNSATSPSFRRSHAAVFDAANQRMLVFGGSGGSTGLSSGDLWAFELGSGTPQWSILPVSSTTPVRESHAMIYDAANQRAVLFGGNIPSSPYVLGDTWILDI